MSQPSAHRNSTSSDATSGPISPTSTLFSTGGASSNHTASPVQESFFGAITNRIRARSRSRSRTRPVESRAPTLTASPEPVPSTTAAATMARPDKRRQFSSGTTGSTSSTSSQQKPSRSSTSSSGSINGNNIWYGRHSNSWLFNDFSVREQVGKLKSRSSSHKQ